MGFSIPIRVLYLYPQIIYLRLIRGEYSARVAFLCSSPQNPAVMAIWRCGHEGCKNLVFKGRWQLNAHARRLHEPRKHVCTLLKPNGDRCTAAFQFPGMLRKHIQQNHEPKESRPIGCTFPDCATRFVSEASLNSHVQKVHVAEDDKLPCPEPGCDWKLKSANLLRQHIKTHEVAKMKSEFLKSKQEEPTQNKPFSMESDPTRTIQSLRRAAEKNETEVKNKHGGIGVLMFDLDMNAAVEAYNARMIGKSNRHPAMHHF